MVHDLESFFKKEVYNPDKEELVSKLTSMYERGEFTPMWFAEIVNYIKKSEPGSERLLQSIGEMYDSEEWNLESVDEIKTYILNSKLKSGD